MAISRRTLLRGLAPTVAFPYLLRSQPAHAAITINKLGNPIRLGATQPGGQSFIALSPFADGSYIAGWLNTRDTEGDTRAFVQKRGRNGSVQSPMIQMGGGPLTDGITTNNIAVVAFPNDTSLVFFAAQRNGADPEDAMDIFVQRMSASFQKVGSPISVNTTRAGAQDAVYATRLKNGNVQVAWMNTAEGIIRGRLVNSSGQGVTPERTVIRHTDGTNIPKALVPGRNGGSVLSYARIIDFNWQKNIQMLKADGTLTGPAHVLDTATLFRPFGAAGLMWSDPLDPDESAYVYQFTPTGNVSEFHQFDFIPGSPPDDDFVRNLRTDPSFQGASLGARVNYHDVVYDFNALRTETNAGGNTITAMLVRQNGSVAAQTTLGPFDPNFLNPTAGILLPIPLNMPEYIIGYAAGNIATDDRIFVQRLQIGYGP